jgi:hypothetical protein
MEQLYISGVVFIIPRRQVLLSDGIVALSDDFLVFVNHYLHLIPHGKL